MFATIEGVSSARHLSRLCERDLAYLWLRGGVGVNHHLLSDFRTAHGQFLDQLLTDTIAEFPNAECRNRGLQQFRVRGLQKARAVSLWHAIVFNFMRMVELGCVR